MRVNALQRISGRATGLGILVGLTVTSYWLAPATAQVPTEKIFGDAIHRYYDGDYEGALGDLAQAVKQEVEDPRVYYLRGLALLHTQRLDSAQAAIKQGAELEALQYGKRNYNIARSLQRIQGNERAMIETARVDAMQRRSELRSAKAGIPRSQILAEMGRSILDPPPVSTSRPNLPDTSTLEDATAPFGQVTGGGRANSSSPSTAPKANTNSDDPFGTPPSRGQDDPFADPPARNQADPFGG